MTLTAAGCQTAGPIDFGFTLLEQPIKGQLKSIHASMWYDSIFLITKDLYLSLYSIKIAQPKTE